MSRDKPSKPYKDFPLYPHPNGQWAKKIRGKMYYFGVWGDWKAALESYLEEKDSLQLGVEAQAVGSRQRSSEPGGNLVVAELCNEFLNAKLSQLETGDLSLRTFNDYKRIAGLIVDYFGNRRQLMSITPQEFTAFKTALSKGRGVVALGNCVRMCRVIFRYASEARLVDTPVYVGPMFKEPSKTVKRRDRQSKPKRMFSSSQLRKILNSTNGQLRAMILLGINCGYGNTDCSSLPSKLPVHSGFIRFPRPKTAVDRVAWLWKETKEALDTIGPSHHETFFRTERGFPMVRAKDNGTNIDRIAAMTKQVLRKLDLMQPGLNFYALRHTFETVASNCKDQQAVDLVMGHVDESMAAVYREDFDLNRVKDTCSHVHDWLFES